MSINLSPSAVRSHTNDPAVEGQHPALVKGADFSEIKVMDLRQFRNSNLSSTSYLLLLLPVIGWIALGCLKYHYVTKHRAAEQIMKKLKFDSKNNIDEKIVVISKAIKVSGPHAWQYRFELARLHLLQGKSRIAANDLAAIRNQRGKPSQTGNYNVRKTGLVSFRDAGSGWSDGRFVMQINYHNGYEALLYAAIFAANEQYVEAYDAYNEVLYYNRLLSHSRQHQRTLVDEMNKNPSILDKRGRDIITAEEQEE